MPRSKDKYAPAIIKPAAVLQGSPQSLGPLYRAFVLEVRKAARAHELPLMVSGDKSSTHNITELGFAATENWGRGGNYSGRDPGHLIIHWPSIFRWDSIFTLESLIRRGFGSFVVLLLQFEELFRRRSPLLWELLQRKVRDLFKDIQGIEPHPSHVPLSPEEERVLRAMFYEISSGESPLLPALAATFYETFKQFQMAGAERLKTKIRRTYLSFLPLQDHEDFSLMQTAPWFFTDSHAPGAPAIIIAGVDPKKFTAARLPSLVYELLVAYDLTTHGASSECGVQTLSETGTPYLMVLNMKRFVSYRCSMGFEASSHFTAYDLVSGDPFRTGQIAAEALQQYLVKHAFLQAPSYDDLVRARFFGSDHTWPALEWDCAVVINVSELPRFLGNLRYLEEGRTGVAIRYERREPRLRKSQILNLVFRSQYGQQIPLTALRHRKKLYFSPQFGVPNHVIWSSTRMYRGVSRRRLNPGVMFKREFNSFFFTIEALFRDPTQAYCRVEGFEEWIKSMANMPISQFKTLANAQVGGAGDYVPRASRSSFNGLEFTPSEDAAICEHYHIGMKQAQWDAILTSCPGRNKDAIVRRARVLALNMVQEGEYEIEKLPVQRRGSTILNAIRRARGRDGGGDARR